MSLPLRHRNTHFAPVTRVQDDGNQYPGMGELDPPSWLRLWQASGKLPRRTGMRRRISAYRRSDRNYASTARKFRRRPCTRGGKGRNGSKECVRSYGTFPHRPSLSGNAVARYVRRHVQGNASSQIRRTPDSIEGIVQRSGGSPVQLPAWLLFLLDTFRFSKHRYCASYHPANQRRRFGKPARD